MIFEIENLEFELPALTLLTGPMAAAKPIFAQKFAVKWLNKDGKVAYFATSSPVEGVISNLKILGLEESKIASITFFDYNPNSNKIEKTKYGWRGNFSDAGLLKKH